MSNLFTFPLTVRVIWPRGKSYRYENRFYRDPIELEGGLRWLDKMAHQRGSCHCILPQGRMAPWIGDDGQFRLGHSDDVVTMLDDIERSAAAHTPDKSEIHRFVEAWPRLSLKLWVEKHKGRAA